MSRTGFQNVAVVVALGAVMLGACGSDARPISDAVGHDASAEQSGGSRSSNVGSGAAGNDATQSRPPKRILPKNANRQGGDVSKGLPPLQLPWKSEVPVRARVAPACAARGETVRLVIITKPNAAVAFHAVYSDNRGGAEKPFGAGYGGNDKGKAGPDGKVVRSWVIGPTAPSGTGRIDIIVGWEQKWGYLGKPFAVADASGTCDAS